MKQYEKSGLRYAAREGTALQVLPDAVPRDEVVLAVREAMAVGREEFEAAIAASGAEPGRLRVALLTLGFEVQS